ncbi:hypothetical protein ACUIAJ_05510 [Dermabacteraceae bacterium CCM 9519]
MLEDGGLLSEQSFNASKDWLDRLFSTIGGSESCKDDELSAYLDDELSAYLADYLHLALAKFVEEVSLKAYRESLDSLRSKHKDFTDSLKGAALFHPEFATLDTDDIYAYLNLEDPMKDFPNDETRHGAALSKESPLRKFIDAVHEYKKRSRQKTSEDTAIFERGQERLNSIYTVSRTVPEENPGRTLTATIELKSNIIEYLKILLVSPDRRSALSSPPSFNGNEIDLME